MVAGLCNPGLGAGVGTGEDNATPASTIPSWPLATRTTSKPGSATLHADLATRCGSVRWPVRTRSPALDHGSLIAAAGSLDALRSTPFAAVLVPAGDPSSIRVPENVAAKPLQHQASAGALIAGICAGKLVIAASGLPRGRCGTHNDTAELASPEQVAATERYWAGMTFIRADLVHDGQVITCQPWAYRKFAALVGRELGALSAPAADDLETYLARRSVA